MAALAGTDPAIPTVQLELPSSTIALTSQTLTLQLKPRPYGSLWWTKAFLIVVQVRMRNMCACEVLGAYRRMKNAFPMHLTACTCARLRRMPKCPLASRERRSVDRRHSRVR